MVMEKFRRYFQNLYQREEPNTPGLPLETHVNPAKVSDNIPSEADVEAAVSRLRPHRMVRNTRLHAKQFKLWKREAYPGEKSKTPL